MIEETEFAGWVQRIIRAQAMANHETMLATFGALEDAGVITNEQGRKVIFGIAGALRAIGRERAELNPGDLAAEMLKMRADLIGTAPEAA